MRTPTFYSTILINTTSSNKMLLVKEFQLVVELNQEKSIGNTKNLMLITIRMLPLPLVEEE